MIKFFAAVWALWLCAAALSQAASPAGQFQPFADMRLQSCFMEQAQKNQWTSPAMVVSIRCNSKGITRLDGIEQFGNLEELSLYNNKLSRVSLQGLAHLTHLNLAKNNLELLQLEALPALVELYVFDNQLTQLQLAELPALQLLKINDNHLTRFDYAALPHLEKIYLFNNKLETVDIYHLPAMSYMDARQNPMPDKLYEDMDKLEGVTILHDGNAKDWN